MSRTNASLNMAFISSIFFWQLHVAIAEMVIFPTIPDNTSVLYWYKVAYDPTHPSGYIKVDTPYFRGTKTEAELLEACPYGLTYDCLRAFEYYPVLPTNSVGVDQLKSSEKE